MSMDVGGAKGGLKADINVTPLVDVMLVLLIIMMLVAPMLQKGVDVRLPQATNSADKPETQDQTVVAIAADKRMYLNAVPIREDDLRQKIVEVLEGKRLAHVHAYRSDEMLMMLRLAEEFGFEVATFEHGLEGYKVARELAAHGAGVGTFSAWWGFKIEAIDAIPYNAALMTKAGVVVSIAAPWPVSTLNPMPRCVRSCTVLTRWRRSRPSRPESVATSSASVARSVAVISASRGAGRRSIRFQRASRLTRDLRRPGPFFTRAVRCSVSTACARRDRTE